MHRRHDSLPPFSPPLPAQPSDGTTFVLSGGASRGSLQVGMLQVLLEHGIVPTFIVGTSVGAFNGAYLACRPTAEAMRALEDVWLSVRHEDVFAGGPVGVILNLVKHQPSLYSGEGIRRLIERVSLDACFHDSAIERLAVPLAIVATNITRGQPAIFESGPIVPALLASSAIPAALPPVTLDGEQYVDGGLLDNVGLRVAATRGARRIFVLDTSWEGRAAKAATTLDAVIERSLQVVMAFHLQCALEAYSSNAEIVLLRADDTLAGSGNDFSATPHLIAAGRDIAERALARPRQESVAAMQRGPSTGSGSLVGPPASDPVERVRSLRDWVAAAAAQTYSPLVTHLRHIAQALGRAPTRPFGSYHHALQPREQQAG